MERSSAEKRALWGSAAVVLGSLLPWASDLGDTVWGFQTAGLLTLLLGLVAWWQAAMWQSPVSVGIALALVLVVWVVGVLVVASAFERVAVTVFVVPVGAAVGITGARSQAPGR